MDAANLNMINWAAALRGNRRKGAALLRAMLADPVQRAGVCSDPDALSLIFGYGPDDPLAEEARGIPASAVVCYANNRYGTTFASIGEMASSVSTIGEELAERGALWNMVMGTDEAMAAFVGCDASAEWLFSVLGSDDAGVFSANSDLIFSGTEAGNRMIDVLFSLDCAKDIAGTDEFVERGAGNARFLHGLAKCDAARDVWASKYISVSSLFDQIKATLDAAPQDLFIKVTHTDAASISVNASKICVAVIDESNGKPKAVLLDKPANWKDAVSGSSQIALLDSWKITPQTNYKVRGSVISTQTGAVVETKTADSNTESMPLKKVLAGGAGFFESMNQDASKLVNVPNSTYFHIKVNYATYIAV